MGVQDLALAQPPAPRNRDFLLGRFWLDQTWGKIPRQTTTGWKWWKFPEDLLHNGMPLFDWLFGFCSFRKTNGQTYFFYSSHSVQQMRTINCTEKKKDQYGATEAEWKWFEHGLTWRKNSSNQLNDHDFGLSWFFGLFRVFESYVYISSKYSVVPIKSRGYIQRDAIESYWHLKGDSNKEASKKSTFNSSISSKFEALFPPQPSFLHMIFFQNFKVILF